MCWASMSFSGRAWNNWPPSLWPPTQVRHSLHPSGITVGYCCWLHSCCILCLCNGKSSSGTLRKHLRKTEIYGGEACSHNSSKALKKLMIFTMKMLAQSYKYNLKSLHLSEEENFLHSFLDFWEQGFTFHRAKDWEIVKTAKLSKTTLILSRA